MLVDVTQAAALLPDRRRPLRLRGGVGVQVADVSRGTAFMALGGDAAWTMTPDATGCTPARNYERVSSGGRSVWPPRPRFDVSPAWLPWIGGVPSLELLCDGRRAANSTGRTALAATVAGELDLPWDGASLVLVPVGDLDATVAALASARIKAGVRNGSVRLSTHVYNTPADAELVGRALGPLVAR